MTLVSTRPIARAGAAARFAATAALLVATLVSTACFSSETVIRVKADGTGTIEQTNLANKEMLGMAAGMAKQAVKDSNTDADRAPNLDNIGDLFDEAKIREQATTWGQGVRYVSSTPITENGLTGVKAVFAFDDIRLVATNSGAASGAPAPRLRFDLQKAADGTSAVQIRLPQANASAPDAAAAPAGPPKQEIPPEALTMVRQMFKGAHMSIAVEVDGAIVSTDAPKQDGSRVTVFALDLDQLLSDPTKFSALQGMKPGTDFATARKALEGVPGVILPQTPSVSIAFR